MKKIMMAVVLAIGILTIQPVKSMPLIPANHKTESTPAQVERSKQINARLYEIKAMDKSTMSSSEKKALRKEVKAMKQEMREGNGGIYLSLGAIIIIILLLIILL